MNEATSARVLELAEKTPLFGGAKTCAMKMRWLKEKFR